MKRILCICCWALLLIACSNGNDGNNNENAVENEQVEANDHEVNANEDAGEEENNEVSSERFEPGDDVKIEGSTHISETNKEVIVEGKTNLLPQTILKVVLKGDPFEREKHLAQDIKVEVEEDGSFESVLEVDETFFETYNERPVSVEIELDMLAYRDKDILDLYGEKGENFSGILVYQREANPARQIIYHRDIVIVEAGDNTYDMTIPSANDVPEDYGETEVWMDVAIVRNDHHYIYLEGKSNLLEGILLYGNYYKSKENSRPSGSLTYTNVRSDGSFTLPISYESIEESGVIEITGYSAFWTGNTVDEVYGKEMANLTGDIVSEERGRKSILLEINNDGKDISVPENSLLTEEDGEYKIRVPDDVLFDFDKSDLKAPAKETLNEVIALLEAVEAEEVVQVIGHTDDQGADDYNLKLSKERAQAVEAYLLENGDVDHLTFESIGYGKTKPIESNQTEEGQQKNRRVEIIFKSNE